MKRQNCINFCIKVMLSIAVTFISCAGPSEPNSLFYKEYVIGQAPGIVRGIEIISGESLLSISWLAAERAGEYEVFISTTETLPDKPSSTTQQTSLVITRDLVIGTTYYLWVRGINDWGEGELSAVKSCKLTEATEPPAAPAAPSVKEEDSQLRVSWKAVPMAASYDIYCGDSTTMPDSPAKEGVAELYTIITGLTNDVTYYIWVKARNSKGVSPASSYASGTPQAITTPPDAPKAPVVSAGNAQISISWEAVNGAAYYQVYYGASANSASASQFGDDTAECSVTITGLTNGTTYYVWLKASNSYGTSGFSPRASGTPVAPLTPPGDMGDVTLEIGNGQLTARWEAVGGADSYEVFFSQSAARPENAADTVNALYKTITGLTNGNTYYIWVRPRNQRGAGGISGAVSGKPMGNPGTLTVMPEDGKLIVSWNAVPGADSYDIYYGTTETPPAAPVFTGRTGNSAEITGLLNGTIYYVWFKAKQTSGAVSELSERVRGKPRVVVPAGLYDNGTAQTNKIGNQNLEAAYTYLNSYAVSGHTYYIVLGADEETYSLNFNYPGKTVGIHIQGNGLETTVTLGANTTLFTINEGVTMTLSDIILQGRTTNASYRLINVTGGALVIESDAKITGNGGGGISVSGGGTLTMNGGEISGHVKTGSSSNTGGGVYVTAGSFAMHGGEIKGNTGWSYGGGVGFISSGGNVSFVMDGGTISGNSTSFSSSSYGGGGVYVRRYSSSYTASFTMSGGAISDNSAQCGGGVYVDQYSSSYTASFTMSGGTISGNTASYYQGGGVYSSGTFIMNNGTISGNTASYDSGGGVYSSGTFTMSGGTISGNTASSSYGAGGGVYVGGGTFTKSGTGTAVIYGSNASDTLKNTASSNNGHAVYVNSGSKKRNTTARAMDALDSSVAGAAGGWE